MLRIPFDGAGRQWSALLTLSMGLLWGTAQAQPLDLAQAYEAALRNDAGIRAARAGAEATRERLPMAKSQLLPNVALNAGRNYNDLRSHTQNFLGRETLNKNDYYSYNAALAVRQPLYRPALVAGVRQAEAQVRESDAQLEQQEQQLVIKLGQTYFDALLAQEQLELVRAQKTANTSQLDAAQKRYEAGSGTVTDVSEAQARLDLTLADEIQALQHVEFTRQKLRMLTGVADQGLAGLDTARFEPLPPEPAALDEWVARAEGQSPEIAALQARVEGAEREIEKARAGHKPTLDAVAQWTRSSSDSVTSVNQKYENKTLGVQLSVPLYQGGYVNAQQRAAVAQKTQAQETLEAARRDLGMRVYEAFRGMTEGVSRIRALELAVESATKSLEANRRSFEGGVRTTLDVLDAEQQRTRALRDLAQARFSYLVARLQLLALAGDNRETSIQQVNGMLLTAVSAPAAPASAEGEGSAPAPSNEAAVKP